MHFPRDSRKMAEAVSAGGLSGITGDAWAGQLGVERPLSRWKLGAASSASVCDVMGRPQPGRSDGGVYTVWGRASRSSAASAHEALDTIGSFGLTSRWGVGDIFRVECSDDMQLRVRRQLVCLKRPEEGHRQ